MARHRRELARGCKEDPEIFFILKQQGWVARTQKVRDVCERRAALAHGSGSHAGNWPVERCFREEGRPCS